MKNNKSSNNQFSYKPKTKAMAEALSKHNAEQMVAGKSKLKSWGNEGWMKSSINQKWIHYRSKLEKNTLNLFESRPDLVEKYENELVAIPYQWKGATLYYVPDLLLKARKDKQVYMIEVKYKKDHSDERNQAKWRAALEWCRIRKIKFVVASEKNQDKILNIIEGTYTPIVEDINGR